MLMHVIRQFIVRPIKLLLDILVIFLASTVRLTNFIINIACLGVHVATTYFAYKAVGFWAAVLTFVSPPVSELWWAFDAWMETGIFLNLFTLMILGIIALYVFQLVLVTLLMLFSSFIDDR